MDTIEKFIIESLEQGLTQPEIAEKLKKKNITPNSLSSVEKRLKQIREKYKAKTLFHLAFILHNIKVLENTDSRSCE